MGEVYRAKDLRLGRDVAIKVLPATALGDADRLRRFEQEARAAGSLNHPNVVAIFDTGVHEGAPFVVSELLEGETLQSLLAGGPLPLRKVVDYTLQIASGLAAAHEKGIVHRDLKPDNVFVTHEGLVKLLDFGLAKVRPDAEQDLTATDETLERNTAPGTVLGTAGYMSPEQVRGLAVDARSDVFALGAILYEMLSGRRAFRGDTAVETMHAILKDDPPEIARGACPRPWTGSCGAASRSARASVSTRRATWASRWRRSPWAPPPRRRRPWRPAAAYRAGHGWPRPSPGGWRSWRPATCSEHGPTAPPSYPPLPVPSGAAA